MALRKLEGKNTFLMAPSLSAQEDDLKLLCQKFGFCFWKKSKLKIGQRTWPKQCKTAPSSSKFNSTGIELLRFLQSWWLGLSETDWLPFLEETVAVHNLCFIHRKLLCPLFLCKNRLQRHSVWKQWAARRINKLFLPSPAEQLISIGENQFSKTDFICKGSKFS